MYSHTGIQLVHVAIEVSCHCCVIIVFDVKNVTLESINDSVFGLSYILDVTPVAFKTIYKTVTLGSAFSGCTVGFIVFNSP